MAATLEAYGFETTSRGWRHHTVDDVRTAIRELTSDLGRCDVFVLYVAAHAVIHDACSTCQVSGTWTDGEIYYMRPWGEFLGHAWSLSNLQANVSAPLQLDTGPGLLHSLRDVGSGHIEVILDMCYSGLLIDAASLPSWGGPAISASLRRDQTLTLLAAARRDQEMYFSNVPSHGQPAGGLFSEIYRTGLQRELPGADSDSDGRIERSEYEEASKNAMRRTEDWFDSPVPSWQLTTGKMLLRVLHPGLPGERLPIDDTLMSIQKAQDPLSHRVRGAQR
jgi:hypothetical protein